MTLLSDLIIVKADVTANTSHLTVVTNPHSVALSQLVITLEAEPADPALNKAIEWYSNGTGYGNAGDKCTKINSGGVVKSATIVPYSVLT